MWEPPERVFHSPVRDQIAGMSRARRSFGGSDSLAFRTECEDVSSDALALTRQGGAARPDIGNVSIEALVLHFSFVFIHSLVITAM